jgi:hypothetical protein
LVDFLTEVKRNGSAMLGLKINDKLARVCKLEVGTLVSFSSHHKLDGFVNNLMESANIQEDFPREWKLLKSFDRAFWMRYYSMYAQYQEAKTNKHDELIDGLQMKMVAYSPIYTDKQQKCPFKDPTQTGSMMIRQTRTMTQVFKPQHKYEGPKAELSYESRWNLENIVPKSLPTNHSHHLRGSVFSVSGPSRERELLYDSKIAPHFYSYVCKDHSHKNSLFLRDVHELLFVVAKSERYNLLEWIYTLYLGGSSSDLEVNV